MKNVIIIVMNSVVDETQFKVELYQWVEILLGDFDQGVVMQSAEQCPHMSKSIPRKTCDWKKTD